MIREATQDDIPALVALGDRIHHESPRWSRLRFSAAKLEDTLCAVEASDEGFLWVALDSQGEIIGGMVGIVCEHWCSHDLVASDLALFVAPEARGTMAPARLVRRYKAWAEFMGAKLTQVGVTTGVHTEQTAALFERLGLKRCGVILEA